MNEIGEQARICAVCGHREVDAAGDAVHICELQPGGDHSDDYCMECERPAAYHAFEPVTRVQIETPGLTEARKALIANARNRRYDLEEMIATFEFMVAAEARVPLEARIVELATEVQHLSDGPSHDEWWAANRALQDRAEAAERKLKKMRETLELREALTELQRYAENIRSYGGSFAMNEDYIIKIASRALAPPASTIAEEPTDA